MGCRPLNGSLFSYYGAKWSAGNYYPIPKHTEIVEPFAGAAGYSCHYPSHSVTLYEVNPIVFGVWQYLLSVKVSEFRSLPISFDTVDNLKISQEAKWFLGFWIKKGSAHPGRRPSAWIRGKTRPNSVWGECIRSRVAADMQRIRHWKVINASYETAPNREATWFIDPPYQGRQGGYYPHRKIDYAALAEYCMSRRGQAIVCEGENADWLPFVDCRRGRIGNISRDESGNVSRAHSLEYVWTNDDPSPDDLVKSLGILP